VLALGAAAGCRSPYYADRGAAVGAVTGALAGAALGEGHGNASGGALIGAAAGALAGTAIGDAMDQEAARSQALIEQRLGRPLVGATTVPEVVAMTQAGLRDEVIVTHIRVHGVAAHPTVQDLLYMQQSGVREPVMQAMQQTAVATVPDAIAQPPIVVEEHVHLPPPWASWSGPHHRHWHGPPRRFHWGVTVSN
jgi:hypothetical protein